MVFPFATVRSLFYSYNTYIIIVCPIKAHYCYFCVLTLALLYYRCRLVSFHCSCILWTPIYTEVLSFGSTCLCEFMWCIRRLPSQTGILSDFLSFKLEKFWGQKWASKQKCTTKINFMRINRIQGGDVNHRGWITIFKIK